jgi:hypothetical protein
MTWAAIAIRTVSSLYLETTQKASSQQVRHNNNNVIILKFVVF